MTKANSCGELTGSELSPHLLANLPDSETFPHRGGRCYRTREAAGCAVPCAVLSSVNSVCAVVPTWHHTILFHAHAPEQPWLCMIDSLGCLNLFLNDIWS